MYNSHPHVCRQPKQVPTWYFQHILPQKLLNLLLEGAFRDQMVWTSMWEHLSSWLLSDLICHNCHPFRSDWKIQFCFKDLFFFSFSKLFVSASPTILSISLYCAIIFLLPLFIAPLYTFLSLLFSFSPIHFHIQFLLSPIRLQLPSPSLLLPPWPQAVVDGSETSVVLDHLSSLTEYQLAVFAVYANEASEALRGSETTCT